MGIKFLEFGEKGQVIVFLHGWQQDKRSFSPLVPYLHQHYRLILLDLPGFGQSENPPENFTSYDFAQTIAEWLKQQKLSKVILVGHSFGGKVASIIASQYPDQITKLVLIANSGIVHLKFWNKVAKIIPQFLKKYLASLVVSRDYRNAGKLLPIFKTIVKEDLTNDFKNIKKPTLIIWGKNDSELPVSDGQKVNELIKNSHLEIVEGNHSPFLADPEKIALLINNFIVNDKA